MPFLSVASIQREEKINGAIINIVVKIMADNVQWRWIVECKKIGQPREVRHSLLELRAIMAECNDKNVYGVVAAPFLSVESRRLCVESGVGYVDLAGNARLSFGTVFIELHAVGNPFMEQRSLRSIFTPKSGRVLKVLLEFPLHAWKVQDLVSASGVSMGQVSNVRKLLLQREWAR
ncbi:MAG: hypothetical protein FD137_40 [Spirochaetes bacterium]|nr:MAG: hypothetical protein FD137_40 [Spirochaetota bacterium]